MPFSTCFSSIFSLILFFTSLKNSNELHFGRRPINSKKGLPFNSSLNFPSTFLFTVLYRKYPSPPLHIH